MKHRSKLVIEIIGIIAALVIGGTTLSLVADDDQDDDCYQNCQIEEDD